ncbi:family 14 glycosylhydrolase [Flammeovirga agarivorans]|uniref:Beta-amylase n=1 Tax=Flammeovirga agarivorans TaxID=2726742 RepID=A0A7X8XYZ0_9BACT|nr:family 14 glycosylhydrolase [Flammeovirga agarivorans]NLR94684.1 family 14 glycosylhydrolase [Flammeovirga agarivorans]
MKTFEIRLPYSVLETDTCFSQEKPDWTELEKWVIRAKKIGVNAVVVPVLWKIVEGEGKASNDSNHYIQYDWTYYRSLLETLASNELHMVIEFNFHMINNYEQSFLCTLPDWLWGKLMSDHDEIKYLSQLKYVNKSGGSTQDAVSLWADHYVMPYYEELVLSFKNNFKDLSQHITKFVISTTQNGELSYPINECSFPRRNMQCYSPLALDDWDNYVREKYKDYASASKKWGVEIKDKEELIAYFKENDVLQSRKYNDSVFGNDVSTWYNKCLTTHGNRTLHILQSAFSDHGFEESKLCLRLPIAYAEKNLKNMSSQTEVGAGIIAVNDDTDHKTAYYNSMDAIGEGITPSRLGFIVPTKSRNEYKSESSFAEKAKSILSYGMHHEVSFYFENESIEGLNSHVIWDNAATWLLKSDQINGLMINNLKVMFDKMATGSTRLQELIHKVKFHDDYVEKKQKSFRVMGPLHVKTHNAKRLLEERDWQTVSKQLDRMRDIGVSAVSIDIWWGLVEGRQSGNFDWSYYDSMVKLIESKGLNWVPILSFHQAGGNVNDDFLQMIPLWVWGKIVEENPHLESIQDLQYVSETGDVSVEYVSLWADTFVMPYYERFMKAFKQRYKKYAWMTDEINISLGPAGELRYPSYNSHDWGDYPNRGTLQCYSRLAKEDFQRYILNAYGSIDYINEVWQTKYEGPEEIPMPNADELFKNNNYSTSRYGLDFFNWYNQSLANHGNKIIRKAVEIFDGDFKDVPVGFKMPGIHWLISDPNQPRVAEITAGLIAPYPNIGAVDRGEYKDMLKKIIDRDFKERVVLHFTCLEKMNKDWEGYSRAEDLVMWFSNSAKELDIQVMGENALYHELYAQSGWDQIEKALTRANTSYTGITILRMQNLFSDNNFAIEKYAELINRLR